MRDIDQAFPQHRLHDGEELSDGPTGHGSEISGETTPTLTITNVQPEDAGHYVAIVADSCATPASNPASLTVGCPPDLNGDGTVNTQDFIAFLNLWAASDPAADWNADGTVDTRDFVSFLNDWAAAYNNGGVCA